MKIRVTINLRFNRKSWYDNDRTANDISRDARNHLEQWITQSMSQGITCPDDLELETWMDKVEIIEE